MKNPGVSSLLATASLILASGLLAACVNSKSDPAQPAKQTQSDMPKTSSLPGEEEAAKLRKLVADVIPVLPGSAPASLEEAPKCFVPRLAKAHQELEALREKTALAQGKKMLVAPQGKLNPAEPAPGLEPVLTSNDDGNSEPGQPLILNKTDLILPEITLAAPEESIEADALSSQDQISVTDLTAAEIKLAQDCITPYQQALFARSPHGTVREFGQWQPASGTAYFSEAVGGRYVNVHLNQLAGSTERSPYTDRNTSVGATLAVPSFTVAPTGRVHNGPLVLLEKMEKGFQTEGGNWRYTIVGNDGDLKAVTGGLRSNGVDLCKNCPPDAADRLYDAMRTAKETSRSQP